MLRGSVTLSLIVTAAVLAGAPDRARAGWCDVEDAADDVALFERFAKKGGKQPELDDICVMTAFDTPRLRKRLLAACELVLTREPTDGRCVAWAAGEGMKTLGGVDLFTVVTTWDHDPFVNGPSTVAFYLDLGDPRAVAPTLAAWQRGLADPRAAKKKHAHEWLRFRNNAIILFGRLGGAGERDFLTAQLPLTKDRAVKKRMQKSIADIAARLAAGTPTPATTAVH